MRDWNDIQKGLPDVYPPIKTKICPIMSDTTQPVECLYTACAWWDGKYGRCAVLSQACKK